MKSILQSEKECYVCANRLIAIDYDKCSRYVNLEEHHIFFGTANRSLSEKYGLKVYLCQWMHRGDVGVHNNKILDNLLKMIAQKNFEEHYKFEDMPPKIQMQCVNHPDKMRAAFIAIFGRSYL
jgi:hypothetical protein